MINNLKSRWQAYTGISGYETFENDRYLVFKSPYRVPWHNMVYLSQPAKIGDWKRIIDFFSDYSFRIYIPETLKESSHDFILSQNFEETESIWEMTYKQVLQKRNSIEEDKAFRLDRIRSSESIDAWLNIAANAFRIPERFKIDIVSPIIEKCSDSHDFYVAYVNDIPLGTCFTCTDLNEDSKGIYAVSILEQYRNQGFGSEIIKHLISSMPNRDPSRLVLSTGGDGLGLYSRLGFQKGRSFIQYDLKTPFA